MALGSLLDATVMGLKANRDHAVPSLFPPIKLQQRQVVKVGKRGKIRVFVAEQMARQRRVVFAVRLCSSLKDSK